MVDFFLDSAQPGQLRGRSLIRFAYAWTVRELRLVRVEMYVNVDETLEAAGVAVAASDDHR